MDPSTEEEIEVLLVDDEQRVSDALAFALEGTHIGVRSASNAAEMWSELDHRLPALVVLDLQLKDVSGIDLSAQLRSNPNTANLPILMLSGFTDPAVKKTAFDAGVDDYITKPFSPDELVVRIRAQLARRSA